MNELYFYMYHTFKDNFILLIIVVSTISLYMSRVLAQLTEFNLCNPSYPSLMNSLSPYKKNNNFIHFLKKIEILLCFFFFIYNGEEEQKTAN